MVTYTTYHLEVLDTSSSKSVLRQFWNECEGAQEALEKDGSFLRRCQWLTHEEDLKAFSRKYPQLIFQLFGEGNALGDVWIKYFKDGMVQRSKIVTKREPRFDPAKLK